MTSPLPLSGCPTDDRRDGGMLISCSMKGLMSWIQTGNWTLIEVSGY